MDCYSDFASIYDILIEEDVDYKKWSNKILEICKELKVENRDYLDLACGTGNITIELYKNFGSTHAIDLSQEMLTIAREKLSKQGIKPKLSCQDLRNLKLNKKFDLITCVLDGTNYLLSSDDLLKYFNGVKEHLKDNGVFIFDINSYYKLSKVLGNNIFSYDSDEVTYVWNNSFEEDLCNMDIIFFVKNEDETYERIDESHVERAYAVEEIEDLIKKSGLKVIKKLDNYSEELINEKTERIVFIVKKEEE